MTFVQRAENTADDSNQKALEEFARAIEWNAGEFSLILAHCNSVALQQRLVPKLRKCCSVDICEIVLDKSVQTLFGAIQSELGTKQPEALIIYGLESVSTLDKVLAGANNIREEFRKNLDFPLVVWVTEEVLKKIIRLAPDFYSWATTVEFQIPTHELVNFIEQTADAVFSKVLEAGAGVFLDSDDFELGIGSPHRVELESAQHELQNRGVRLSAELEASLEFVLSRDADSSIEQSRHHLERSLELWQTNPNVERLGCVLYSLGVWWYTFAERNRTECDHDCAYAQAKDYFQRCVDVFEQANRPDLSAKFINVLGVTLQKQKKWDELATVAQKALNLHQIYCDPFRLARAYGLLAELQLAKLDWEKAKEYAQEALSLFLSAVCAVSTTPVSSALRKNLDWALSYHQGCYLLALARAQQGLNLIQEAIKTLEKAKVETKIHYDPPLYLQILEELRKCYFQQRLYLTAFEIKQQQRSIEQQYGFRAFIGAGRLQAKQQVDN
ncbi:MAG: tetratricopeptide repeat protein, partial [Brasilonema sp.]